MKKEYKTIISSILFFMYLLLAGSSFDDVSWIILAVGFGILCLIVIFGRINLVKSNESKADQLNKINEEFPEYRLIIGDSNMGLYQHNTKESVLIVAVNESSNMTKVIDEFLLTSSKMISNYFWLIDNVREKVLVSYINDLSISNSLFNFEDIIGVELNVNGQTIYEKSSLRTVGGALAGGALFGGAGAVVGGLSGSSKVSEKISKLELKLILRDVNMPSFKIILYEGQAIDKNSDYFKKHVYDIAILIKDSVTAIINLNDKKLNTDLANRSVKKSIESNSVVKQSNSVADEISKLLLLRNDGVITNKEFEEQKRKLLDK